MRLGAAFPVATTLGWAPSSDHAGRPSPAPDGFTASVASDLALLASLGVTDVRVPVDWARLQPRAGEWDGPAHEWVDEVLRAAATVGVRTWVTLFEGPLPAWFADEGGFGDDRAAARWWPRWCDHVAETFGDRVGGWMPMIDPVGWAAAAYERGVVPPGRRDAEVHAHVLRGLVVAWRDAWRVLRGGPPVATVLGLELVQAADQTVPARQAARRLDHLRWRLWLRALRDGTVDVPGLAELELPDLAGACDVLGGIAWVGGGAAPERWHEDLGTMVRRLADEGPDRPVAVTVVMPPANDSEATRRADLASASAGTLQAAAADGVRVDVAFVSPALGGLVTRDRNDDEATAAWQRIPG